jgi:acyl-CoA thioesterase-1
MVFPLRRGKTAIFAACFALLTVASSACNRAEPPPSTGSTAQPQPQEREPARPSSDDDGRPKVVCLGDSLTAGLGLVETESYPSLLQKKIDAEELPFEVVNAGVSGDTSAGGLRRLDWALQGDVKVLIVALGGNDALRGLSVAEMRANISAIVARARDKGVIVMIVGMQAPPNFGQEYTVAFRQVFFDVAREYRTPLVPFLLDRVAGQSSLNQADGIHPNAQGAEIVAQTVWNSLRPILQQMSSQ